MLFFKETNQTHIRPPANPSGTPIAFSPWGDTAHLTSHYWFRRTPYATKINPRLHLPPFDLAKPLAPSFQAGVTAGVFRRKTTEHHRFRSARLSPQSWHSIPLSYLYQVHIYMWKYRLVNTALTRFLSPTPSQGNTERETRDDTPLKKHLHQLKSGNNKGTLSHQDGRLKRPGREYKECVSINIKTERFLYFRPGVIVVYIAIWHGHEYRLLEKTKQSHSSIPLSHLLNEKGRITPGASANAKTNTAHQGEKQGGKQDRYIMI